jgi:hypothetical protein
MYNRACLPSVYAMATHYIGGGVEVDVRFLQNKRMRWFRGHVTRVRRRMPKSVACDVQFEDGEHAVNVTFADDAFEDEHCIEAWRFAGVSELAYDSAFPLPASQPPKSQPVSAPESEADATTEGSDDEDEEKTVENHRWSEWLVRLGAIVTFFAISPVIAHALSKYAVL